MIGFSLFVIRLVSLVVIFFSLFFTLLTGCVIAMESRDNRICQRGLSFESICGGVESRAVAEFKEFSQRFRLVWELGPLSCKQVSPESGRRKRDTVPKMQRN